jgi:hypothetical protein
MSQMVFVVVSPLVLAKENLDPAPCGLNGVSMVPGVRINKVDAEVYSAVADDHSAGFDPGMYYGCQFVSGFVWNRHKKCSAGPLFNTTKHPLTLNGVSSLVLTSTELALVNFDGLIRTTNLFRAALHKHQHGFPAKHAPVGNSVFIEVMFLLDLVGRFAAYDVIHEEKTFQEAEMTLMEPRAMLDGQGFITHGTTNLPSTSPTKSRRNTGIYGHFISQPLLLHCTLLRNRPTSLGIPRPWPVPKIGTLETSYLDHRLSSASDVQRITLAQSTSLAGVAHTP